MHRGYIICLLLCFLLTSGCSHRKKFVKSPPSKAVSSVHYPYEEASPKENYPSLATVEYLIAQKKYDRAIDLLSKGISISPSVSFYRKRAEIYLNRKNYSLAKRDLGCALEMDPPPTEKLLIYSTLLNIAAEEEDLEEEKAILKKIDKLISNYDAKDIEDADDTKIMEVSYAFYSIGLAYFEVEEYQKALNMLQKAVKLYPDIQKDTTITLEIANVYFDIGKYKEAKEYANKWLKTQKHIDVKKLNDPMYLETLSVAYKIVGNYEKSLKYINKAISIDDDHYMRYLYRAAVYRLMGKDEAAMKDIKRALQNSPKNSKTYKAACKYIKGIKAGRKVLIW